MISFMPCTWRLLWHPSSWFCCASFNLFPVKKMDRRRPQLSLWSILATWITDQWCENLVSTHPPKAEWSSKWRLACYFCCILRDKYDVPLVLRLNCVCRGSICCWIWPHVRSLVFSFHTWPNDTLMGLTPHFPCLMLGCRMGLKLVSLLIWHSCCTRRNNSFWDENPPIVDTHHPGGHGTC